MAYFYIAWVFYNSVGVSEWTIFTLLGCSISVWVCLSGLFLHCLYALKQCGCVWVPILTLLVCSISVWVCLGGLFLHCLYALKQCGCVWVAYFNIACMLYISVGVSGWPILTLLVCSISVWVCLGGLFLHCLYALKQCGCVWVAYFNIACMLYISVGVSGWPIFTLLVCSKTVWVCLGGLFFHFYSSVVLFG